MICYSQSLWELYINHITGIWINVHVTTVTTATDDTDSSISYITILCTIPCKCWLYIHLHRLEIQVKQVWIDLITVILLHRKVSFSNSLVGRVILPIHCILQVHIVDVLEVRQERIVIRVQEELVTVRAEEQATELYIVTHVDINNRCLTNTSDSSRVTTTEDITLHLEVFTIKSLHINTAFNGYRSEGIDIHDSLCRRCRSRTDHTRTHRHCVNEVIGIITLLIQLIVLIRLNLGVIGW